MLGFLHWQDVKPGVTNISLSIFREGQAKAGFPGGSGAKASAWNVGDQGSIPGSGRSSGEGNGNPIQHPCLENSMDRRAWYAAVHGVAKSWTRLSAFTHSLTQAKAETSSQEKR